LNIAGVIAEFNPFHNGHVQLLTAVRKFADLTVVAMSGNFVQRGDIAVYPKALRAKAAVDSGLADLVLELPAAVSLSSAQGFARGAVELLQSLEVITHLAFGSESGDLSELRELISYQRDERFDASIRETLKGGVSYPSARQNVLERIAEKQLPQLREANNILALEYLQALEGSAIEPLTFKRPADSVSATRLRELLRSGADVSDFVPFTARRVTDNTSPLFAEDAEFAILATLKAKPREFFDLLTDATEGLGRRLFHAVQSVNTLQELYTEVKTKRYTLSRIRRMTYRAWLGITSEPSAPAPYVTVLAANKRGRELKCALPLKNAGADDFHKFIAACKTARNVI
jgi:predicted nucleotidyltransferase